MDDLVERLITARDDDHERGCQMRFVVCSCGYDDQTARAVGDAKDHIDALQAEVARLHMLAKANNNLAKHNGDAFKNERMTSALLADALDKIAEATSAEPDAGENYRWDDREGALDYAYATARQALKGTDNAE